MRGIDGKTIAQTLMGVSALVFIAIGCFWPHLGASGDPYMQVPTPPPPPPKMDEPPKVNMTPLPIPQPPRFTPGVVVPTDVTQSVNPLMLSAPDTGGAMVKKASDFPQMERLSGPVDFILVKVKDGTDWQKVSPYAASLKRGSLLCGVRKPSNIGMVETPNGQIAISSGADVLVSFEGNAGPVGAAPGQGNAWDNLGGGSLGPPGGGALLRVMNMDGLGETCKVKLTGPMFSKLSPNTFSLAPGVELVASTAPLTRADLRPNDGISRRKGKMIDKNVVVNRFSVESALKGSDLIASMARADSGSKERRIISEMSKMAAVLNQVHGSWGFEANAW